MLLRLTCYYRTEFLSVIWHFVSETARCFGASADEMSQLALASEEAFIHIVEGYPADGPDECFELCCRTTDDGLEYTFSNLGAPVDTESLPKYTTDDPESTMDGLRFFLIERLVDRFEFVNQGRHGWRTVIFKKIENLNIPSRRQPEQADTREHRDPLKTRMATREDVASIIDLAYQTYRYSYTRDLFYYADRLSTALKENRVISFVAVGPDNRIVGQMALLVSDTSPAIAELGAMMIRPEYRKSSGLLRLLKAVRQYSRSPESPFCLFYGNLVTTHTISQQVSGVFHFRPMAFLFSVHEKAQFMGISNANDQRESLLYMVRVMKPVDPVVIHVPLKHSGFAESLFQKADIPVSEVVHPSPDHALEDITDIDISRRPQEAYAVLTIKKTGRDILKTLRKHLYQLDVEGMKTVLVRIPAWQPMPCEIDSEAEDLRLFFSGFSASTPAEWHIIYTHFNAQPFDFTQVHVHDEGAQELLDYIEKCYREIIP